MHVEASVVAVLIASSIVVVAIAASLIGTAALLYAYRRLEPQQLQTVRIQTLAAMVENLEQQVRQLRTKKAGKASAAAKGYVQEAESSPELDGLNEDERALFM